MRMEIVTGDLNPSVGSPYLGFYIGLELGTGVLQWTNHAENVDVVKDPFMVVAP